MAVADTTNGGSSAESQDKRPPSANDENGRPPSPIPLGVWEGVASGEGNGDKERVHVETQQHRGNDPAPNAANEMDCGPNPNQRSPPDHDVKEEADNAVGGEYSENRCPPAENTTDAGIEVVNRRADERCPAGHHTGRMAVKGVNGYCEEKAVAEEIPGEAEDLASRVQQTIPVGSIPTMDRQSSRHDQFPAADIAVTPLNGLPPKPSSSQNELLSSPPGQNDHCTDDPTEEGSLFEDSNGYGDEIGAWMQQRFEQQQSAIDQQIPRKGDAETSSITSAELKPRSDTANKQNSKRVANDPATQKSSSKRRRRQQLHKNNLDVDQRSPSRKRMDEALYERDQSQTALREACLALERAKKAVNVCRSRYASARTRVKETAKAECESLLQEESQWNDMFHKLKVSQIMEFCFVRATLVHLITDISNQFQSYKEEHGHCNVRQNFAGDDRKSSSDLVRRLSVWVAKNRKEGKLRGRGGVSTVELFENVSGDVHNARAVMVEMEQQETIDPRHLQRMDPDSILADPYKEIALDSVSYPFI